MALPPKRIRGLPNDSNPVASDRIPFDGATTRSAEMGSAIASLIATNTLPVTNGGTGTTSEGTAGQVLTSNGPGNNASWQTVTGGGSGIVQPQGRLTLVSGDPTPATAGPASTLYYTPYIGSQISRYTGLIWVIDSFAELSLAGNAAHAANTNYDVFFFDDSGTKRIGTGPAWISGSSRGAGAGSTQVLRVAGIFVNAVSVTLRNGGSTYAIGAQEAVYLGTVRTTASAGFFEDSSGGQNTIPRRFVWNAYNRIPRHLTATESAASWSYTTSTWRRINNNANNQAWFVIGVMGDAVDFAALMAVTATSTPSNGISLDWSSGPPQGLFGMGAASGAYGSISPSLRTVPSIGFHSVSALESGNTGATFYGATTFANCGLTGTVMA